MPLVSSLRIASASALNKFAERLSRGPGLQGSGDLGLGVCGSGRRVSERPGRL